METLTYGKGLTGAELMLNKSGIEHHATDMAPAYTIRVRLSNKVFTELYPTLELAKLGASYWRRYNKGTVRMRRIP